MKHALAGAVQAAAVVLATWIVGAAARGPLADESVPKDFAAGAAILGGAWALQWSARELEKGRDGG